MTQSKSKVNTQLDTANGYLSQIAASADQDPFLVKLSRDGSNNEFEMNVDASSNDIPFENYPVPMGETWQIGGMRIQMSDAGTGNFSMQAASWGNDAALALNGFDVNIKGTAYATAIKSNIEFTEMSTGWEYTNTGTQPRVLTIYINFLKVFGTRIELTEGETVQVNIRDTLTGIQRMTAQLFAYK